MLRWDDDTSEAEWVAAVVEARMMRRRRRGEEAARAAGVAGWTSRKGERVMSPATAAWSGLTCHDSLALSLQQRQRSRAGMRWQA